MRTILAPGVEWKEIDKSGYSPAMTGSNALVIGFTDKGEPYQPMEFTSVAAWANYYGSPTNEAERYAYASVNEVLNNGGRLYFSRLPYDNPAFEKVAGFKYDVKTQHEISCFRDSSGTAISGTPFWEVVAADPTVKDIRCIEPKSPALYDLSAIDEYRTDENKVANNTILIADIAFNTYGKIPEDSRKDEKREMIGVMPVITTAANAMYQQHLIDVDKASVIGYETIGKVVTIDAGQLSDQWPQLVKCGRNDVLPSDMARLVNTKNYYKYVSQIDLRTTSVIDIDETEPVEDQIYEYLCLPSSQAKPETWNGSYQILSGEGEASSDISAQFTYVRFYTETQISSDPILSAGSLGKFGWHNPDGDDNVPSTVSQEANSYFPTIDMITDSEGNLRFDRDNLKKIGVVVFKMFMDPAEGNKISFEPVEAYAGSLCRDDKDPNTGATTFIDTIVNSQSKYINFFSNCFNTKADREYYVKDLDMLVVQPGAAHSREVEFDIDRVGDFPPAINALAEVAGIKMSTPTVNNIKLNTEQLERIIRKISESEVTDVTMLSTAKEVLEYLKGLVSANAVPDTLCPSLGFFSEMTKKEISITKSIYDGMNKTFAKNDDINERDIDLVPDGGVSNIASCIKALFGEKGLYDLTVTDDIGNPLLNLWKCSSNDNAVKTWKTVLNKFDAFCKSRRDCMFIADGPRPLVLAGQKKIVRSTKPANTIDANIIPNLKWLAGVNTSYGAMYVDWFEQADDYSGDFFWCPPSIKAMGAYVNTDVNFNYWDAPAGLTRGLIAATDVAFSPTVKQAGAFYEKNLNYAINYPQDGIVLEGQKTLQVKPSAFDRVNVRRLFLRLERMSYKVARYFVYEPNNAYTRQRLVDALDPYFRDVKNGGGIYEYKIKCDDSNNTATTIDRNELHVSIGIKATRTAEFILLDFVALATGGSWTEAGF